MTSTSVNDIRSLFPGMDNRLDTGLSSTKSQNDSFTKIMDGYAGKNVQTADTTRKVNDISSENAYRVNKNDDKNSKMNTAKEQTKDSVEESQSKDAKKIDKDTSDKAVSKIEEETGKIKEAIKDELGVSDEQIEAAMELLGMSMQDLMNAGSVKDLMLELTGTEDALTLLTDENLLNSINNVMDVVNESVNALETDLGISEKELSAIIDNMPKQNEEMLADTQPELKGEPSGIKDNQEKTSIGEEKKITVEVNRETSELDVKADNVLKVQGNTKSSEMTKQNSSDGNENFSQASNQQTVVTTEVNNVGDVIQTVRSFAGEYSSANEIINQVTEHVKVNITPENTSMEMQLHPASLGTVTLQIASQDGIVTAHLTVQNENVRAAMVEQMEQLQKTFEEQGQKVENIEVTVANYDLNQNFNNETSGEDAGKNSHKSRKAINLNELTDDMLEELDEEDKLQAAVMDMNGNSVNYTA